LSSVEDVAGTMHKLVGIHGLRPRSHFGDFPLEEFYRAADYIAYMIQELNIKFIKEDDKKAHDWLKKLREKEREVNHPILRVEETAFALALLGLEFVKQADVKIHKDGSWQGWFKVLAEEYIGHGERAEEKG